MVINIDKLEILKKGTLTVQGEFMWGSNYTFLAKVELEGQSLVAVYKPSRGERPLWDFPTASLARREAAAFIVSELLGWNLVPETVYRENAALGPGSLQLFIDHDPDYHYFNFSHEDRQRLRPAVIFDLLINNADRKGSHVLKDAQGHLWLIDHGVCFHSEDKLRSVIWDFVGEPIPDELCSDVIRFTQKLRSMDGHPDDPFNQLRDYLSRREIRALGNRADALVSNGHFPRPDPYRRPFPWPQI
jgi:uncharacterized repeat protein (TIGR03843 family)